MQVYFPHTSTLLHTTKRSLFQMFWSQLPDQININADSVHYSLSETVRRCFKKSSILEILVKTGLRTPPSFHLNPESGTSSALYSHCRFICIFQRLFLYYYFLVKSRHIQRIMFDFES